ncbi:4-hydroxythreonine-4-phosphate dehydrogenase [Halopolyspora algeriensis]|uniref:4-hydroxythreonine-4-phosphate dehydrogenase n=1 Tax=Halopolyspora algeriensis TaxID=1500506 RepID=A0A368VPK2_9ACTN|nr:four-carbon acid sugar kinase family protein [Halopolyspora algeriensis]RCW41070.1 4-hydroxythreonine-4-phosphate dehydrogenase [Halopolyspora algeriensis]TQM53846.1 4-hydroxythreonine-4-phosphate dehydrogenase [Halopolyspora algeriensis]
MSTHPHPRVLALADDLSGAAETAACLHSPAHTARIELVRTPDQLTAQNAHSVLVMDLDSRAMPSAAATHLTRTALQNHASRYPQVFFKIDSLLRGNTGTTVRNACTRPVVVAPALPAAGRTVVDGVLHVHEVPLHETGAWQAEHTNPPATVAELFHPLPCRSIPLETVRSGRLSTELAACAETGDIPICDSRTDSDLDEIVAAANLSGARLIGAGGLAAALGRSLHLPESPSAPASNTDHQLLVVVGTADPGATDQVRTLAASGVRTVTCDAGELIDRGPRDADLARILTALERGPAALTIDAPEQVGAARARNLVQGLATTVARAVERTHRPVDLVLTGGETARRALDALAITSLTPMAQIHHGAVHSRTPSGTSVVTRPGSFGDTDSLIRIVEHLRPTDVNGRLNK